MLTKVKLALRITTDYFNEELADLIEASKIDLGIAGVDTVDETDPIIQRAIITYCKVYFGQNEDSEKLKKAYDEMKAQLRMSTGYTDWGGKNG